MSLGVVCNWKTAGTVVTSTLCSPGPGSLYVGLFSMVAASKLYMRCSGALEVPPAAEVPPSLKSGEGKAA